MNVVGIVLAGGKGTRLGELTKLTNKHLLPVGEYPMIYHPIKKLVGAGICDICIVSGTDHMGDFIELLGSGKNLGCNLTYRVQEEAGGIAQALGLCERFAGNNKSVVLLGDNIFKESLHGLIQRSFHYQDHAWINLKKVKDPERYGAVIFKDDATISGIMEKPEIPPSHYAVTGIYIFPPSVFEIIKTLKPSRRGELEITDVNNKYIELGKMGWRELVGYWTDAGTPESYYRANRLVNVRASQF